MKQSILSRYEKDNGKLIINVALDDFKDAYEFFDRTSPFIKRDLDYDLVEYITDGVEEIKKHAFYLRIDLPKKKKDHILENRLSQSIANYFSYEGVREQRNFKKLLRRTFVHFFISLFFIITSIFLSLRIKDEAMVYGVILESVSIAAWVFMWPVFSDFLYDIFSSIKRKKLLERIATAEIVFSYR